ncbi:MAG TPA: AbrB/MazE/SpoVT family DNA-binding domain-containing protein [Caulobacteraceae bacterium]|jgi:bifunctional DNA-binding transcriptional regulator/antitoxin component of YhaV-PrlF toxin-antitoxin module|nr:AbrB/MazE/SpoVT family DNA-binding domain-containing protein [Caulobacteraceae bacterium]
MSILIVEARGQVTFHKNVLQHLGVRPGEKIELDKLPDGRVALRRTRSVEDVFGILGGMTDKVATLEELNEAATDAGWAGQE